MTRTQIYLPDSQLRKLKKRAAEENTSVSELIRRILDERHRGEKEQKQKSKKHETLLEAADRINKIGIKGPKDLATNMDKYLYGNI